MIVGTEFQRQIGEIVEVGQDLNVGFSTVSATGEIAMGRILRTATAEEWLSYNEVRLNPKYKEVLLRNPMFLNAYFYEVAID